MGSKGISFVATTEHRPLPFAPRPLPSDIELSSFSSSSPSSLSPSPSPLSSSSPSSAQVSTLGAEIRKGIGEIERSLERVEDLLTSLAETLLPSSSSSPSPSHANPSSIDHDLTLACNALDGQIASLSQRVEEARSSVDGPSASVLHLHLLRLQQLKAAAAKSKTRAAEIRNRRKLFVRGEGKEKERSGTSAQDRDLELLMAERISVAHSHRNANDFLLQAEEVRETLDLQNERMLQQANRTVSIKESFPGMNSLIEMIQNRKRRNAIILSLFIALLICALIWYWFQYG